MSNKREIRLVVFDWAGTTVDFGCFAPVAPFIEAFARHGVTVTLPQARSPMGLHKKDHIRRLLEIPNIAEQWEKSQGRGWTEADVEMLFTKHFVPLQMSAIHKHAELIPGLLECVQQLRQRGIKIATTTGYFTEAAQTVYQAAWDQGLRPDANLCAEDVPQGRPAPWMIFRHMETLGIYPPAVVLKVGDTVPDIEEGLNAGTWSAGVTHSSSNLGLTYEEFSGLSLSERQSRTETVRQSLLAAHAHDVVDSVADVPVLVDKINQRILNEEKP